MRISVGEPPRRMAERFVEAWHQAERGEPTEQVYLSFESWDTLSDALTGKRLQLLRHVRRHPVASIAELARGLKRDYKRVYQDVERLAALGLVTRDEDGRVHADYDEIRTSIPL